MKEFDKGRFDALEKITTAYYGKQMYVLYSTTMVFSRVTHSYMPLDYAIAEFSKEVTKNESKT